MENQGQIFAWSLEPMENGASIAFGAEELSYRSKKDWSILSNIEEADSNMEESSGLSISRQDGVCLCQSGDEQCCRLCEPLGKVEMHYAPFNSFVFNFVYSFLANYVPISKTVSPFLYVNLVSYRYLLGGNPYLGRKNCQR